MSDASGATAWSYDSMGRAVTERRTIGTVTKNTAYAYNLDGSVASLGYPSGRTLTYAYSGAGRALSAVDSANGINFATAALYAPPGALNSVKYGASGGFPGIVTSNSYNSRLQPVILSAASPAQTVLSLTYDFHLGAGDNGNVFQIVNNRDSSRTQAFTYDSLNRIATAQTATSNLWGETFTIDAWGNLTNIAQIPGKGGELLNAAPATAQNQLNGYCHDAAGNMTGASPCPASTYVYDAENRLKTAAGVNYTYDGDGKRVKKDSGKLYWTGTGTDPLEESDLSGAMTEQYVFFNGKRIARLEGTGTSPTIHYYFSDHLGSADMVTNATGSTIEEESDYYPYGGERVITAGVNAYKFTGKERDAETGLDYFGARHYWSNMGRFLTADEFTGGPVEVFDPDVTLLEPLPYADIATPQSLNKYAYTYNNPLRYTDPDGHVVGVDECR